MKKFYEQTRLEVAVDLLRGRMPDGTRIAPETAKDGLARVIPMLKDDLKGDLTVLEALRMDDKARGLTSSEWADSCDRMADVIAKGEKMVGRTL
jgi:hypothetical protein